MIGRYGDIIELLTEAEEQITIIKATINNSVPDVSKNEIAKPKVKSTLELLRSCLDFCAVDIYEIFVPSNEKDQFKPNIKTYFPYGLNSNNFTKSLHRSRLKNIKLLNKDAYLLIESIQPFKCNNNWLTDLCKYTNYNKHDRLHNQMRQDYFQINSHGQNLIRVSKDSYDIKISTIDNQNVDIRIDGDNITTSNTSFTNDLRITSTSDYIFTGSEVNIITLLQSAHYNIKKFAGSLYDLLGK